MEKYRLINDTVFGSTTVAEGVSSSASVVWKVTDNEEFSVGDFVRCISPTGYLAEGQKYIVSEVHDTVNGQGISLRECVDLNGYKGYSSDRFEKVTYKVEIDNNHLITINEMLQVMDTLGLRAGNDNFAELVDCINKQTGLDG